MLRGFFLGFIKIHILHHAAEEPLYGLSLIEELRRHGYRLSPGTVYPILHSLTEAGYLVREDRVVGGKVRKYYSVTRAGRRALGQSRRQIVELVREVVGRRDRRSRLGTRAGLPTTPRPRWRTPSKGRATS
jgi:PadR family transcriptional regulator PadR